MDINFIQQLEKRPRRGGRYRLVQREVVDGAVSLVDCAVTRIENSVTALRLVLPPMVQGAARNLYVRLIVHSDTIPTVTFVPQEGETITLEKVSEEVLDCGPGVNLFALLETEPGVFAVQRTFFYDDPIGNAICPDRNLAFTTSADHPWTIDSETFASSPASARSGRIGPDQKSELVTHVKGAGTLSYRYKVSSERSYDFLFVLVDGVQVASYSGEIDWTAASIPVTGDGVHTVKFIYKKDEDEHEGGDCCWIDDVRFV